MKKQAISLSLYKKIHQLMPIPTVDAVIVWKGKFLLGKRKNKPEKGKWWLPGGRVQKGETLEKAIIRQTKEETGIDVKIIKCLGADGAMFHDGPFGSPTHTIGTVFMVKPISGVSKIRPDSQHEQLKWFSKIDKDWHPYQKKFLKFAGFK